MSAAKKTKPAAAKRRVISFAISEEAAAYLDAAAAAIGGGNLVTPTGLLRASAERSLAVVVGEFNVAQKPLPKWSGQLSDVVSVW